MWNNLQLCLEYMSFDGNTGRTAKREYFHLCRFHAFFSPASSHPWQCVGSHTKQETKANSHNKKSSVENDDVHNKELLRLRNEKGMAATCNGNEMIDHQQTLATNMSMSFIKYGSADWCQTTDFYCGLRNPIGIKMIPITGIARVRVWAVLCACIKDLSITTFSRILCNGYQ